MNMNKILLSILILVGLGGCADSNHNDIKIWMSEQEKKLKGKIDLLPPAKNFTPVSYSANIDPFVVKDKISLNDLLKDKLAPDLKREREYLENFQLVQLKMTGTVIKDGKFYAMILDHENSVNYVTIGSYIGKDYGKIISISEGEIVLEERIKVDDTWNTRETKVFLYENPNKK